MTGEMEHEPTTHEKLDWKLDSITKMLGDEKMSESFDSGALMGMLANKGVDPGVLACMNSNHGLFGNDGGLALIILLLLFGRGGYGGFDQFNIPDVAKESTLINESNYGRLMDAISAQGIRQEGAISQLAQSFGCEVGQVKSALASVDKQLALTDGSVKNAIQQCCCTIGRSIDQTSAKTDLELCKGFAGVNENIQATRYLITAQGAAQDNLIQQKFAEQSAYLAEKFCEIKNREDAKLIQDLRDKIAEKDRERILAAINATKTVSGTLSSSAGTWSGTSTPS